MTIEETIDAFLDGETVQPSALDAALGATEGRAYLIDALALRQLMSDSPAAVVPVRRQPLRFSARAVVVGFALVGLGYLAGARTTPSEQATVVPTSTAESVAPPEPTRVVELKPGVNWHESKGGD